MNHNRDHYRARGRGCARNSDSHRTYGGASTMGYTTAAEPLLPGRPDLSVYIPDGSCPPPGQSHPQSAGRRRSSRRKHRNNRTQRGSGYEVDLNEQIADMPVYHPITTTCNLPQQQHGGADGPAALHASASLRDDLYEAPTAGYRFEPSNSMTSSGAPYNEVVSQNGRACAGSVVGMSGGRKYKTRGSRGARATLRFRRTRFNTSRKNMRKHTRKNSHGGRRNNRSRNSHNSRKHTTRC